ncbi:MAG: response regulator transcription factor [Elusimicrobiota bacterium]|jgi:DNA-binding NarL/FixJ family response regulator
MSLRILLCDDHRIFREGLKTLIQGKPGLQVVGEAQDGLAAVQYAKDLSPDIVIMDISLPKLNGIEATRKILHLRRDIKVIVLSMHSDRRFVTETLKAGAAGYLVKDSAFDELFSAICAVDEGKTYLSPAIAQIVVDGCVRHASQADPAAASPLTQREREVLQLLAEGCSTKQIALKIQLSVKTIETHRMHIMKKLDIHNIAGLTKYSIQEGIISLQ